MAGLAALLFKPALDAALAGTAAKGTMDMNKKKGDSKILDDGTKTSKKPVEKKEKSKEPEYKTLSKNDLDDLMIMLVEGGLSSSEAKKIAKTGYISEDALGKLSPDAIKGIEGLTGIPMAFPTGDKPKGTPPVTGTTVKKQTRTETPEGEVRETTTTFDGNSGVKKQTTTEIPEMDEDLDRLIEYFGVDDIDPNDIRVRALAEEKGVLPETIARLAKARLRTHESLRNGIVERKNNAERVANQANSIHGRTVEVEDSDVMPSHMTKAEQNQERHAGQERLARQILKNEARAKNALLHKDSIK